MKPLLQHLENESLLLLYLAGELPPADRAELEESLGRDANLRNQLQALRLAELTCFSGLTDLDAAEPLRSPEPSMRQVSRSMHQWQIDRLARPIETSASGFRLPALAWSAGSVVAAVLVFCVWWGFRPDTHSASTQPIDVSQYANKTDSQQNAPLSRGADDLSRSAPIDATRSESASRGETSDNAYPNAGSVQVVAVDPSERIGELERRVSEDLQ